MMASRSRQNTVPASGAPAPAGDTRERVLAAAMQVFAERGFDGATLREITAMAGANIAAVNYYFRSKDELIRHVLDVYVRPIMVSRLEALDECERLAGERGPDLEAVVEALVLPMVYLSRDQRGGRALIRLLLQSRALPRDATRSFTYQTFDPILHRFADAIGRAVPALGREDIYWRIDFAVGAMMQILTDSDSGSRRLAKLSGGLCDTDDNDAIAAQLVAFIVGGFQAPHAGGQRPKRRLARE